MSRRALDHSIGITIKENDWGRGGKQLIYGDRIYVYIEDGKVTDWQIMSQIALKDFPSRVGSYLFPQ